MGGARKAGERAKRFRVGGGAVWNGGRMNKKFLGENFFGALYVINVVAQSLFSLALPIALAILGSWLLTERCAAPQWIYAPLVTVGALVGLVSMVRFAIAASENLERLEREREAGDARHRAKAREEKSPEPREKE